MMIMLTLLFRWRVMERPREFVISRRFCIPVWILRSLSIGIPNRDVYL